MEKRINGMILRYSSIILFSLFYNLIYLILAPLTIYSSYFLISLFYKAALSGSIISFNGKEIQLIDACISGLAYLLLLVLNLSVRMPGKKRIKSLCFSLLLFFAFNVVRIFSLSLIFASGLAFFDYLHLFFWYFGSILAVLLIWVVSMKTFRIKEIPFYGDMRYLIRKIKAK